MEDFEDVKKLISSILISSPSQMTIQKLHRDFLDQIGLPIPFTKFGFKSLEQCLLAMPDILEVHGTGMQALLAVHVSDKAAHIDKLIAHQKSKPRKPHFGNRPKPQSRRPRLTPISMPWNLDNAQHRRSLSFPEQVSSALPPCIYIPPALRQPPHPLKVIEKQNPLKVIAKQNLAVPTAFRKPSPLMLKPVSPPKGFVSPTHWTKHEVSYNHQDKKVERILPNTRRTYTINSAQESPICVAKEEDYVPQVNTFKSESVDDYIHQGAVPKEDYVPQFNTFKSESVDDYIHQGAVPKEPGCSPSEIPQHQKNCDIYSSDEEEPMNLRVPLKVQQNLQILIDKYEEGIWCGKIPQVYQNMFNKELDYEEYGYKSLIQMCMDLKTIFFWYRPDKGDFKLYDRTKPCPNDLDKHFKQSDYIKTCAFLSTQPSNEPAVADVEELINVEPEDCYPPDVVQLMEELPRQFLSDNEEDEYIDVCIGEIYDPSKFWLMLAEYTPFLDQLMDDMQAFYMNCPELKIPPHMIKVGLYCSAVYNHEYHRAIIVKLMPQQKNRVKVFYIDYGTVSSTLVANLHFLHKDFFELPQQAIRARLARIYPPTASTFWSAESSSRLLQLVKMKRLVAHLYRIDYTQQILEVFLVDTTGEEDVFMNDTLVAEGHAIFTHEAQAEIPLDSRFVPKVKYVHMIPTFDEMEQGVVPNATEMLRLQRCGVSIEQVFSHYFTNLNAVDVQNNDEELHLDEPKSEKMSSVALRRSQLKTLTENKPVCNKEPDSSLTAPTLHSEVPKEEVERNSPSPEVIVAKPVMRPPPGFESIQEQKIKITSKNVNGDMINTVVTETTNIETNNTQNLLNYIFRNRGLMPNQHQGVPSGPSSGMMQGPPPTMIQPYETQDIMNQLLLLRNQLAIQNTQQQAHMIGNQHAYTHLPPPFTNRNVFNPHISNQQFAYPHMPGMIHPVHTAQPPYYNQAPNPLRLHMQDSIKELLMSENKIILNRFLAIVKKRLLTPGVHHALFNLLPGIINKPVVYQPEVLDNLYRNALCFLNDEDIVDIANEAKSYALFIQSNCASTQTQHSIATEVNKIGHKGQQIDLIDLESNFNSVNITNSTENNNNRFNSDTALDVNQRNTVDKKLVYEIEFQNYKLHIINLENEAYAIVTEVLEIVNQKLPIERVRKCIVMTDPSISVWDIRLQDYKNLTEELSRYMYIDSSYKLHVIPIAFVPKLIIIISNRRDLACSFDNFLRKSNLTNNANLISF